MTLSNEISLQKEVAVKSFCARPLTPAFTWQLPCCNQLCTVIADFGISRVVTQEALKVHVFLESEIRGSSIHYAAAEVLVRQRLGLKEIKPEILKGGDVFSLGVTLLEMLKRKKPWKP